MLLRIRWQRKSVCSTWLKCLTYVTVMEADLNEALMLLMRYSCPTEPHGPYTFVQDAIYLKANTNVDGGITLVTKYSSRAPPRITPIDRPMTPGTPDSHRSRSPFASPATNTVENILHDAARGVVSRGERWGLNQALRDAVGEVRKNVQGLNSGRGSPRTGSTMGIKPLHRNTKSDVSSNIAANVLRKITTLEERNKQLAKMLEGAVADLWKFEKDAAEKKEAEESSLQSLSMAVAKVQFVQVFLQDSTLPLPPEEQIAQHDPVSEDKADDALKPEMDPDRPPLPSRIMPADDISPRGSPEVKPVLISITSPISTSPPTSIPVRRPTSTQTPPPSQPTTSLTAEHASAPTAASLSASSSRPRIEQSSFSWMLGQAHEDRSGFVNASPWSPNERRYNAAHGGGEKGFLFGEEDEVVGEPKAKEKAQNKTIKGQAKGRTNSVLRAQEDIDLGDMGSGAET
jgi:TBC1 domain family protein 5